MDDQDNSLTHARLSKTLCNIQHIVGLSVDELADLLETSSSRVENLLESKSRLQNKDIFHLARAFHIDESLLFSGRIDYLTLAKQFRGSIDLLPEKYSNSSELISRARGIIVIFQYLVAFHGYEYASSIFSRLQVHPSAFIDFTKFVNPKVGTDLLSELHFDGFSEDQIRLIGTMSFNINKDNVGLLLNQKRNPRELYESLHQEVISPYYDQGFFYKLESISHQDCTISVNPREEALGLFRGEMIGSRQICLYKQGVYSSFLANIRNEFAKVSESECIYLGDKRCAYHLRWVSS